MNYFASLTAIAALGLAQVLVPAVAGENGKKPGDQAERSIEERLAHINQHPRLVEKLDANGDGTVDAAELEAAHQARLAKYDTDGDGKLSEAERQAMREDKIDQVRARLEAAKAEGNSKKFDRVDTNSDGSLSDEEIKTTIKKMKKKHCGDPKKTDSNT